MGEKIRTIDLYEKCGELPPCMFIKSGEDIWVVGKACQILNVRNGKVGLIADVLFRHFDETVEILSHDDVNAIMMWDEFREHIAMRSGG